MNEPLKWHTVSMTWNDMIPYEHNARKISTKQVHNLDGSLNDFDVVEIPVIDVDNIIIGGHQRRARMIALGRGDEYTDVRKPNRKLTEEEFKRLNFMLNAVKGDFVDDILRAHFTGIVNFDDFGMQLEALDELHASQAQEEKPELPIVAKMSEKYSCYVIVCTNEIDENHLAEKLGVEREQCYKSSKIGMTHVLNAKQVIDRWK